MSDIIRIYGNNYKQIYHNGNIEDYYENLGISFYYWKYDKKQKIDRESRVRRQSYYSCRYYHGLTYDDGNAVIAKT